MATAKCPKCGKEIDHLNQFAQAEARFTFSIGRDGNGKSHFQKHTTFEAAEEDFECPECQETLCHDEGIALSILKGEETA